MLKEEKEILTMDKTELTSYLEWLHQAIGEECFYSNSIPTDKTNEHVKFCKEQLNKFN